MASDGSPFGSESDVLTRVPVENQTVSKAEGVTLSSGSGATDRPPTQVPTRQTYPRSNLSLELRVNEMAIMLESYKEVMTRLAPGDLSSSGQAMDRSMSSVAFENKAYLCNPMPTPELVALVSKVVSDAHSRVGKKQGGAHDNSLKEHARNTWYRMLGIQAAKEVRPYFEDQYGEPDTLPEQFMDSETKYCQPYPHWKAPLTKQVVWVPTFLLRFRSTIPNDSSELSTCLRGLTDEQIIILLVDGPFKSAQTAWRNLKKTDEELEVMQANARRYQQAERKAIMRGEHIKKIPSLQSPDWDYLSHPRYMLHDESDGEGGLVIKRPETNLYEAIRVAEFKKAKARPGSSISNLTPRRVELVKCPIPHLERGVGSGRFVVRIAACGVSKGWKGENPEEYRRYTHLINLRVSSMPNIIQFLVDNPRVEHDQLDDNQISPTNDGVGDAGQEIGEYDGVFGTHARSDDIATDNAFDNPGGASRVEIGPPLEQPSPAVLEGGVGVLDSADIPVDPQLLSTDSLTETTVTSGISKFVGITYNPSAIAPTGMPPPSNMPEAEVSGSGVVGGDEGLRAHVTQGEGAKAMVNVAKDPGAAVPAKKRGRPPGSKNKPKVKPVA
ncbi:hypothetical protein CTheo_6843 [Ceratobasidium theobromae]|uniref:Uncharacterized protein n=1 Tax=Ceratobasidium theobromae TaxID=1582974 RepID=A0A5N5QE34_9AGAM|nr:hypothetical protein CTheo_6843 [Ceratobasidium theobromae]